MIAATVLLVAASSWTVADVASHKRPFGLSVAPFDLYAVRWIGGQLQFFRGVHLSPRYDQSASRATTPTIVRVAWDAPEPPQSVLGSTVRVDADDFRLTMRSWPPLTERATLLCGGQIAVPGVGVLRKDGSVTVEYREVGWRYTVRAMAAWPIALLLAVAAGWFGWRAYRASIPPGGCPICGYDLRASPERCPECGIAIVPAAPTR